MQSDRREILRKLQQQRQSQRAVSNHDEPTFEPTASLVSLRQFNASDLTTPMMTTTTTTTWTCIAPRTAIERTFSNSFCTILTPLSRRATFASCVGK